MNNENLFNLTWVNPPPNFDPCIATTALKLRTSLFKAVAKFTWQKYFFVSPGEIKENPQEMLFKLVY
jgi:hypothetical protein